MQRSILGLFALALALTVPGTAGADEDKPQPPLFPGDSRLDRTVTVSRPRVYLGELLAQLSKSTQVPLSVDDQKAPVSGIDLTVFVRSRPLREMMGDLQELFSHPYNQWEWQTAGKNRKGYILRYQASPEAAAARVRRTVLEQWGRDLHTFREIAGLPEPQRTQQAATRKDLFPGGQVRPDRLALLQKLTPTDLKSLLQGVEIPIDRSRLTAGEQQELLLGVSGGNLTSDRGPAGFSIRWAPDDVAPMLWLQSGSIEASALGGPHWERPWLHSHVPGWITRSDSVVQEYLTRQGRKEPDTGKPLTVRSLPEWLKLVAASQGIQVVADLGGRRAGSVWVGRTAEQTIHAILIYSDTAARKRGDVYLLRTPEVVVTPRSGLVPWSMIRTLREKADRNRGYLGFDDLLQIGELRPEQTYTLDEEFPDANPNLIAQWRPIFRFHQNMLPQSRARLTSPEGLPYRDAGLVARALLAEGGDPGNTIGLKRLEESSREAVVSLSIERARPLRRRLEPAEPDHKAEEALQLVWEIRIPNQPVLRRIFRYSPRKPLQPEGEIRRLH